MRVSHSRFPELEATTGAIEQVRRLPTFRCLPANDSIPTDSCGVYEIASFFSFFLFSNLYYFDVTFDSYALFTTTLHVRHVLFMLHASI